MRIPVLSPCLNFTSRHRGKIKLGVQVVHGALALFCIADTFLFKRKEAQEWKWLERFAKISVITTATLYLLKLPLFIPILGKPTAFAANPWAKRHVASFVGPTLCVITCIWWGANVLISRRFHVKEDKHIFPTMAYNVLILSRPALHLYHHIARKCFS